MATKFKESLNYIWSIYYLPSQYNNMNFKPMRTSTTKFLSLLGVYRFCYIGQLFMEMKVRRGFHKHCLIFKFNDFYRNLFRGRICIKFCCYISRLLWRTIRIKLGICHVLSGKSPMGTIRQVPDLK